MLKTKPKKPKSDKNSESLQNSNCLELHYFLNLFQKFTELKLNLSNFTIMHPITHPPRLTQLLELHLISHTVLGQSCKDQSACSATYLPITDSNMLFLDTKKKYHTADSTRLKLGERAFSVAGPCIWNQLPLTSKPPRTLVFLGAN